MRPRIGITTSYRDGRQHVDHHYVQAIEAAGGLPLIVPMIATEDSARELAALLDGLVMTGGPGITRGLIGTLPEDLPPVDDVRDQSDALIYQAMIERPLLGICYGMQFANAMHGGTIYGDVTAEARVGNHSQPRGGEPHMITINEGSHLFEILETTGIRVNTYHKQAVADVGADLTVTATASDGVVEAIESRDGRVIGVQFHPERMGNSMQPLFRHFVMRCRR